MFPIHDDTERVHGRPYLNYCMIAINVIVFIWEASATSFFSDPRATQDVFMTYGAVPDRIVNDFPSSAPTIITSMFMHGGIAHIIGNMVFLFVFGDNIEDRYGRIKYILILAGEQPQRLPTAFMLFQQVREKYLQSVHLVQFRAYLGPTLSCIQGPTFLP
jgi:membrane associated rhomboid family serine protease